MERNPLGLIDGVALGERSCPTDIESVDGMNLPGRPARGASELAASARAVAGVEHQLAAAPDRPANAVQIVRSPCARAKVRGHFNGDALALVEFGLGTDRRVDVVVDLLSDIAVHVLARADVGVVALDDEGGEGYQAALVHRSTRYLDRLAQGAAVGLEPAAEDEVAVCHDPVGRRLEGIEVGDLEDHRGPDRTEVVLDPVLAHRAVATLSVDGAHLVNGEVRASNVLVGQRAARDEPALDGSRASRRGARCSRDGGRAGRNVAPEPTNRGAVYPSLLLTELNVVVALVLRTIVEEGKPFADGDIPQSFGRACGFATDGSLSIHLQVVRLHHRGKAEERSPHEGCQTRHGAPLLRAGAGQ